METLIEKTIGEIVARDFRTAAVFSKNNMDFCCGGHKTVREVCEKKNISTNALTAELEAVLALKADNQIDFRSWPLDLLVDYIVKTHHRYVAEKSPVLRQFLNKLCHVHGANHPELFEINRLFAECSDALEHHMEKEEMILFPYISELVRSGWLGEKAGTPPFGSVGNPIRMMEHEHEAEGERFRKIAGLTDGYTAPPDACGTYRVTFAMLKEFEDDLHKHIHLENNILFPGAITLENRNN